MFKSFIKIGIGLVFLFPSLPVKTHLLEQSEEECKRIEMRSFNCEFKRIEKPNNLYSDFQYRFNISKNKEFGNQIILKRRFEKNDNVDLFKKIKQKLIIARKSRVHPVIDNKIILSWNSILLKGLICCYQSLGNKKYLELALKNADFLIKNFLNKKNLKRIFQIKKMVYVVLARVNNYFIITLDTGKN